MTEDQMVAMIQAAMGLGASVRYFGSGGSYEYDSTSDAAFIAVGTAVPEPATVAGVTGLAALGLAFFAKKRRGL
jgi:hypothetical protein